MRKPISVAFVVLLALSAVSLRAAVSREDQKEILKYKLSMAAANKVLAALPPITQYVLTLPDWKARVARSMKQSLRERIKEMESDPKVVGILKQNGLTAREYALGMIALRMAMIAASTPAGTPADKNIVASPENIAFVKAHMKELKPKMDAAESAAAHR